ncbi:MAG: type 1 glutamine amidotransferase [Nitrospirota bacterium]|jgi:GMP synthase-like glutamine amidotransferase
MRALVIKHVRREGPGTLGAFLAGRGVDLDIREMEGGDPLPVNLDGCGLLIVMGGPMNVDEEAAFPFLSGEIELIQEAIERDVPMLGICLGSQLLCKAAGGRVTANAAKEIGWYDVDLTPEGRRDPLFEGLPGTFPVFQWHADTFSIPVGGVNLAASPACAHQALRVGRRAYGLQFHVEVDEPTIREWIEAGEDELAFLSPAVTSDEILREVPVRAPGLRAVAAVIYENFRQILS